MVRILRLSAALVILPALALFAALHSLSSVAIALAPEKASMVPPINRNAFAAQANAELGGFGGARQATSSSSVYSAGAATFASEPTNADAVSLMALSRHMAGDPAGARRLYRHALKIDKRNAAASLWLIEDASLNGRVGTILDLYDILLRTGGMTAAALFDTLATAMREPAIVPYVETRLRAHPPWAEEFWLRTATNPGALVNLGKLRISLLDRGVGNPAGNDVDLVSRLAAAGHLGVAADLVHRLAGKPPRSGAAIRNARFDRAPRVPPFDWETFSESGYGGEIDPATGVLAFFAEDAIDAMVAHQLVEARPGRYAIAVRVRNPMALASLHSSLRLRCAGGASNAALAAVAVDGPARGTYFAVPEGCPFVWVELWTRRSDAGGGYSDDVLVDQITLRQVR